MKNTVFLLLVSMAVLTAGCKKCYYCHNHCQVCTDPHFTITVCSDRLGMEYYQEYLDSLTAPSLGWQCHDTAFDKEMTVCETNSRIDAELLHQHEAGFSCTEKD